MHDTYISIAHADFLPRYSLTSLRLSRQMAAAAAAAAAESELHSQPRVGSKRKRQEEEEEEQEEEQKLDAAGGAIALVAKICECTYQRASDWFDGDPSAGPIDVFTGLYDRHYTSMGGYRQECCNPENRASMSLIAFRCRAKPRLRGSLAGEIDCWSRAILPFVTQEQVTTSDTSDGFSPVWDAVRFAPAAPIDIMLLIFKAAGVAYLNTEKVLSAAVQRHNTNAVEALLGLVDETDPASGVVLEEKVITDACEAVEVGTAHPLGARVTETSASVPRSARAILAKVARINANRRHQLGAALALYLTVLPTVLRAIVYDFAFEPFY